MPESAKLALSEIHRRHWQDPEYRARMTDRLRQAATAGLPGDPAVVFREIMRARARLPRKRIIAS